MILWLNSYRFIRLSCHRNNVLQTAFLNSLVLAILMPVSEPVFAQPARRNLLAPVLLAFLILGMVIALLIRYTPQRNADVNILHTAVYPAHTVFKSESTVVGHDSFQDDLYVLTTLHIQDDLHLPLFLKDFTATLTSADGQQFTTSAAEMHDLPNIYTSFPGLKPLASEPLFRETMINPGESAQGMILLHFPVTQSVWDHRQTAVLHIDLYHQGQQDVEISRASEVAKPPGSVPIPPRAK